MKRKEENHEEGKKKIKKLKQLNYTHTRTHPDGSKSCMQFFFFSFFPCRLCFIVNCCDALRYNMVTCLATQKLPLLQSQMTEQQCLEISINKTLDLLLYTFLQHSFRPYLIILILSF